MTLWATPATSGLGKPETTRVVAPAGLTTMPLWTPAIEDVTVSAAVIELVPAVLRVRLKTWVPEVRVELDGRTAAPSELVKWTVPV